MDLLDGFEEDDGGPEKPAEALFRIDVEGYEGPIDVLLTLARDQKVDLTQISILELADQYLAFVAEARRTNLELAADYLVMAAWLAYLKSRLLIPDLGGEDEPTGEEMTAALAFHLRRLESMQTAGARLLARPRLGRDILARGAPEPMVAVMMTVLDASLYDLLKGYGEMTRRGPGETLRIEAWTLYSVEEALGPPATPARRRPGLGEPVAVPARGPRRGTGNPRGPGRHPRRQLGDGPRGPADDPPERRLRPHLSAGFGRKQRDRRCGPRE